MSHILWPEDAVDPARMGAKAGVLARLQQQATDLPVPAWFALSPSAFFASLTPAQCAALKGGAADVQAALTSLVPDEAVCGEMQEALARLCPGGEPVAVRSSAVEEDGEEHSFAGQWESFLNVPVEEVPTRAADIWRSGFSAHLLAYRRERGLPSLPSPPAILIQRMVAADAAGVAFGADPVTGRRGIAVVSSVRGLGPGLVSGEIAGDTWQVDREGRIVARQIAAAGAAMPILTDEQVRAAVELVRRIDHLRGRPQDIEWAMDGGRLYLLQSRPITALAGMPDPDGAPILWDNSNIVESYGGITTPLTFSFARRAYEEVYRQFCRLMGVPLRVVGDNDDTFPRMIGLIRGRVYYNLLSWYRVLSLLPGFTVNRRFMEQMMGVREGLPESFLAGLRLPSAGDRFRDGLRLFVSLVGLAWNYARLPRSIRRFQERLDRALAPPVVPLELMRPDELAAHYRDLERQLLTRWDAPIVNDFFAMIFFGVLRRLADRWCGDAQGAFTNELLRGERGIISIEPAERAQAMARIAAEDTTFVRLLCEGSQPLILREIERRPAFAEAYRDYLDRFGDRCLEDLKLESATLHDDPLPFLRSVGRLAQSHIATHSGAAEPSKKDPGDSPEERARRVFDGRPLRRALFFWVLYHARGRVRDRENLRFERTRLFGRARRIFVEIGRRFHSLGLLESPRDIFYLEAPEVLGFIEGTTTCTDLKAVAAVRKAEFDTYRRLPAPEPRFETRGTVHLGNAFRAQASRSVPGANTLLRGIGCCPGVVRGRVHVVNDPRTAAVERGEILVAERTDPGWVLLFPLAAGLLVERGSVLSHSAIVARELGLPAIVSVPDATRFLRDGDWVEMDGAEGVVRRIPPPEEAVDG